MERVSLVSFCKPLISFLKIINHTLPTVSFMLGSVWGNTYSIVLNYFWSVLEIEILKCYNMS